MKFTEALDQVIKKIVELLNGEIIDESNWKSKEKEYANK